MLRMELGTSHPHCQHRLGSTVVHTLLFLLLSYSLDQPTNYSHFSLMVSTVSGRKGVGEGGGDGGVCDWVSPPLCCSAHDKPLLFYQDLPSFACVLQIAALFAPCSNPVATQPGAAQHPGLHLTHKLGNLMQFGQAWSFTTH